MKRVIIQPRTNYISKINELGFFFNQEYWLENAYYTFSKKEIETIEKASNECYKMYIDAVQYVIDNNIWSELGIPQYIVPQLIESWDKDDLSLYGRFDFAIVKGTPKLLEFNSDTPTSLFEAAVVQWDWKEELFPNKDQFNSIHEALVASWREIKLHYNIEDEEQVNFACIQDSIEDESTTLYLAATANEANINTAVFDIKNLRYNIEEQKFYTPNDKTIVNHLFKLYPYEWMFNEEFGEYLNRDTVTLYEPLWKAIMSNKYLLNIIAHLYPNSPYVLKCGDDVRLSGTFCKKPLFSREGANITLIKDNSVVEKTTGEYGAEGYIYQELVELESFDRKYPIIGSWIIGGESCGIGIRETSGKITNDMANFVPHIIED